MHFIAQTRVLQSGIDKYTVKMIIGLNSELLKRTSIIFEDY